MAVLNTNTRYLHESILRYAERLTATLPEPLSVCFFVCSGSEANELALRLARGPHEGAAICRRRTARTTATRRRSSTSALQVRRARGRGRAAARAQGPDAGRLPRPLSPERPATRREVRAPRGRRGRRRRGIAASGSAAFLCESLLSCGGQIVLPPGYLAAAYRHARAAGGVCIADEVQVGFGRVGTHFWGFETQGVVPDIVTMGKPIGNGHPLARRRHDAGDRRLVRQRHGVLQHLRRQSRLLRDRPRGARRDPKDERLQERARARGRRLRAGLEELARRHAIVGDVRGLGLFLGIELVRDRETLEPAAAEAAYVVERMKDHGILLSTDGPLHNVIKMKPPLVFSEADADRVVAAYDRVLGEDFVTRLARA